MRDDMAVLTAIALRQDEHLIDAMTLPRWNPAPDARQIHDAGVVVRLMRTLRVDPALVAAIHLNELNLKSKTEP